MASRSNASLDEALSYALAAVGHKKTARLVRAVIFSDGIEDGKQLAPQLAVAIKQAVDRQLSGDALS
jgi:hypothetical protein